MKNVTIKVRLLLPELFAKKAMAYQAVARALENLGGAERHVDRSDVIAETRSLLDRTGFTIKNLDATVSSFCALDGVDAIFVYSDGHTTPFQSKRKGARQQAVTLISATPASADAEVEAEVDCVVADEDSEAT